MLLCFKRYNLKHVLYNYQKFTVIGRYQILFHIWFYTTERPVLKEFVLPSMSQAIVVYHTNSVENRLSQNK
jgi:muramidase (phage lysozyme)